VVPVQTQPVLSAIPKPLPATASISAVFNRALKFGTESEDVKRLQQLLATDSSIYPNGKATGYFGAMTRNAIRKFQKKYGIAKEGQVGYGDFGPKTRAKIREVFGTKVQPAVTVTPFAPQAPASSASLESMRAQLVQLLDLVKVLQARLAELKK